MNLHKETQIPNFAFGKGPLLRKEMALAIEPMVNEGNCCTRLAPNKWEVLTEDGSFSTYFKHTIIITDGEAEIFT